MEAENCKFQEESIGWKWEPFHSNVEMEKCLPGNYGTDYFKSIEHKTNKQTKNLDYLKINK